MYKFFLIILIISAQFISSCNDSTEEDIKKNLNYYLIGMSHFKSRDYNKALASFKEDFKKTKNLESLFKLSEISILTNDPHNAEVYLNQILDIQKSDRAFFQKAVLYKKMGRYNDSITLFSKLLNNKQFSDKAYYNVIDMYVYLGLIEDAVTLFETDINKIKNKTKIEYIFVMHFYKKDNKRYSKYFKHLLAENKDYDIFDKLVHFYFSKEDYDTAQLVLKVMAKQFPMRSEVFSNLGQLSLRHGLFEEAKAYFLKAEKQNKRSLLNKLNLATVEIYNGNEKGAEKYLKEALGIKSHSIEALLLIGLSYYMRGETGKSSKIIATIEKNTLPMEVKEYRAMNVLIDFYMMNIDIDAKKVEVDSEKVKAFVVGNSSGLAYLKLKLLNQIGSYQESIDTMSSLKKEALTNQELLKEAVIAGIFLKKKQVIKEYLPLLKKEQEVYRIWADYGLNGSCKGLEQLYKKYKQNHIFIDIYTSCLMKDKKFKKSKIVITDFIKANKLPVSTLEYLKNKIIVINYNLLQQQ